MMRKREIWLDGLKGFAILLVILGHVLSGYLDAGTFPAAYGSLYRLRSWIYSFHMPLFFLLSGFTFTLAYAPGGHLKGKGYLRQLGNLFWLYTLFALLLWVVKSLFPQAVNVSYTLADLKAMYLVPLGNFWYLYVLFVLYLLGALLRLPAWQPQWLLLLGGISIVVADIHLDWYYLTLYRVLYHLGFFALGCLLCSRRGLLQSQKLLGIAVMFLSTATFLYWFQYCRDWYANWKLGIALATCYVYLYLFQRFPQAPFQALGRYCLELYLFHPFFTAGLRSLLPLVGITTPWLSVTLNFGISTLLSLALALLFHRFRPLSLLLHPGQLWR